MAEKIISGDSLQNEFVAKFNGMADEVNALKESGGGGGTVDTSNFVTLDGFQSITGEKFFEKPVSFFDEISVTKIAARRSLTSEAFTHGEAGQVLKSDGTNVYWGNDNTSVVTGSGDGSTNAIIDVDALPSDNINLSAIYRIHPVDAHIVYNGGIDTLLGITATVQAVDTLPEEGSIVIDVPNNRYNFYYQTSDGGLYGYVRTHLVGIETDGWMPFNELKTNFSWSFSYGGVISSMEEATAENTLYMLYKEHEIELYHYKNGWHKIGFGGDAIIDVEGLPSTNINTKAFYRTSLEAKMVFANYVGSLGLIPVTINVVGYLPSTGEPVVDSLTNITKIVMYYQASDGAVWCWGTTDLGLAADAWLPASTVFQMMSVPYGGVINSLDGERDPSTAYVLVTDAVDPKLFYYKNKWYEVNTGRSAPEVITVSTLDEMWANITEKTLSVVIKGKLNYKKGADSYSHNISTLLFGAVMMTSSLKIIHTQNFNGSNLMHISLSEAGNITGMEVMVIDFSGEDHSPVALTNPEITDITAIYITNAP